MPTELERTAETVADALEREFGNKKGISRREIDDWFTKALFRSDGLQETTREQSPKDREAVAHAFLLERLSLAPKAWRVVQGVNEIRVTRTTKFGSVSLTPLSGDLTVRRTKVLARSRNTLRKEFLSTVDKIAESQTLAAVTVSAVDSHAARERGRQKISDALAMLQLLGQPFSEWEDSAPELHLVNDRDTDNWTAFLPTPYRRHIKQVKRLVKGHLWKNVQSLLRTSSPSDVEERLLRALRWNRRAAATADADAALLLYAIGVEAMVGRKNGNKEESAYRCAWLHRTKAPREKTYQRVIALFSHRNPLAHGGAIELRTAKRFRASRELLNTFACLVSRADLRRFTNEQYEQYWREHHLR